MTGPARTAATWRMPGRIEVLGKHTDYGGGRVLVCAVDRGITVRGELTGGEPGTVRARTDVHPDAVSLRSGEEPPLPPGHWGRYVHTVLERLTKNFGPLPAAELTATSNLPPASGMSSSSALLTATAMVLADLAGITDSPAWTAQITDRVALAGYAASIENGKTFGTFAGRPGVGTSGGSLDHTGMLTGRDGMISYAEFDPMRVIDTVPLAKDWSFVVAVSGVLAEKTGAAREAYNRGPALLTQVVQEWNRRTGRRDASVQAAVRSLVGEDLEEPLAAEDPRLDPLREILPVGAERDRLEQFLRESGEIVPRAHQALRAGDIEAFAQQVEVSQQLAATHLGNQVPQTIQLVDLARELGAASASSFGAGFGGSVWALVPTADAPAFAADWLERYRAGGDAPEGADVLITRPGVAGTRVDGAADSLGR
ncbi:galactokinase family protein [Brachybacterium sp. Marseille-Q7125]|uniref:galactokinase family protein n=1 Tax=Brachybacterium sp. Marseille-Q7125 TaxID=2932815 RepID=UPI001FF5C994